MKEELRIFFTALMFYTRIPCPSWIDHSYDYINKATRYFPLIGWIVGLISFAAFWATSFLFFPAVAVIFSLMAGVLTTGAFHEDGLADSFDGFGGGWTKEKILAIMKDSRVGTFGALSLIFLMLLKFLLLAGLLGIASLNAGLILPLIFIAYHALARMCAISLVFTMPYAREDASSKAKPIAQDYGTEELLGVFVFGTLPLLGIMAVKPAAVLVLIPLIFTFFYARNYFQKWLGGYTGDCLGAVEQIAEVVVLLGFFMIWKFM